MRPRPGALTTAKALILARKARINHQTKIERLEVAIRELLALDAQETWTGTDIDRIHELGAIVKGNR